MPLRSSTRVLPSFLLITLRVAHSASSKPLPEGSSNSFNINSSVLRAAFAPTQRSVSSPSLTPSLAKDAVDKLKLRTPLPVGPGLTSGAPRTHLSTSATSTTPDPPLPAGNKPGDLQSFEEKHLWLEEVEGKEALAWVKDRNKDAIGFVGDPKKDPLHDRLLSIYDSKDKIPYASKIGSFYYNFWTDENNIRGIWRRTTLDEYKTKAPGWETVIDLDALGKEEGESWVWKGCSVLREGGGAQPDRVLMSLSRGGSDAAVVREFDLNAKAFVAEADGGFVLPEGKSDVSWQSRDVVIVGADFGEGSLTSSGYPRVVKEWKRGTPLSEAYGAFEGITGDVAVGGYVSKHGGVLLEWRTRSLTFYTSKSWLRPLPGGAGGGGGVCRGARAGPRVGVAVWGQAAHLAEGEVGYRGEGVRGGKPSER